MKSNFRHILALFLLSFSGSVVASDMIWVYIDNHDKFRRAHEYTAFVPDDNFSTFFSLGCRKYEEHKPDAMKYFLSVSQNEPISDFGARVTLRILVDDDQLRTYEGYVFSNKMEGMSARIDDLDTGSDIVKLLSQGNEIAIEVDPVGYGKSFYWSFTLKRSKKAIEEMISECEKALSVN